MAKKRRKHQIEKEEKEYKPPEFDKKEFMETEINVAKGTILAALLAIPMGIVAFLVMPLSVAGGLLVGLTGIGVVYFVLTLLRVGVHSYKITHWLGVISSYFFLFLAVWILLCNPPFSDQAGPDIRNVRVNWDGSNNYTEVSWAEDVGYYIDITTTGSINLSVRAEITDNENKLRVSSVELRTSDGNNSMRNNTEEEYFTFEAILNNVNIDATQIMTIYAEDVHQHESTFEFVLI